MALSFFIRSEAPMQAVNVNAPVLFAVKHPLSYSEDMQDDVGTAHVELPRCRSLYGADLLLRKLPSLYRRLRRPRETRRPQ